MIANAQELKVAVRNLKIIEQVLRSLREQLETSNPRLFEAASKAYIDRIESLQQAIAAYLAEHPAELSLILPSLEQATLAVTPSAPPST